MKRLAVVFLLLLCGGSLLFAQELPDEELPGLALPDEEAPGLAFPEEKPSEEEAPGLALPGPEPPEAEFFGLQVSEFVTLYFSPTEGGSPEAREFFDVNLPLEIKDPYYQVVDDREDADFLVSMSILENENAGYSSFTLGLVSRANIAPMLDGKFEMTWDYYDLEEMYAWDVGGILAPGPPASGTSGFARRDPDSSLLFVGFRGGMLFSERFFQQTANYDPGVGAGFSLEGGIAVELRPFRYLYLQLEGDIIYEAFEAPRRETYENKTNHYAEEFSSMSIIVPFMAKIPLRFGRFLLGVYTGAYYIVTPWQSLSPLQSDVAIRIDPPFGFIMGMDLGLPLGPGEFFLDLRYERNFGNTFMGEGQGPQYSWSKTNVCLGYRFGFFDNF
jgi:hypothetical protein